MKNNEKSTTFDNFEENCIAGRFQKISAGKTLPQWVPRWFYDGLEVGNFRRSLKINRLIEREVIHDKKR